jgi:hypothetical protein
VPLSAELDPGSFADWAEKLDCWTERVNGVRMKGLFQGAAGDRHSVGFYSQCNSHESVCLSLDPGGVTASDQLCRRLL